MGDQIGPEDCCLSVVMTEAKGWVGLPPIEYQGIIIDGHRRLALCKRFGWRPPALRHATSRAEAARLLAIVGHPARAAALADGMPLRLPADARAAVDAVERAAVHRNARLATLAKANNRKRERRHVVARVKMLRARVLETGQPATAADLDAALGEWS